MRSDSPGIGRIFNKQLPLPTDLTLFGQITDALKNEFPNNRITVNSCETTIRIGSISTNVVHEITIKRVL